MAAGGDWEQLVLAGDHLVLALLVVAGDEKQGVLVVGIHAMLAVVLSAGS